MKLQARPGIYRIYNIINGKFYVGSSKNIKRRKTEHFRMLRKGTHHNKHLQNSVDKYGIENFFFVVMEYCEEDEQFEREQFHLDSVIPAYTYNISTVAEGSNGTRRNMKGKNNPFWNKKHKQYSRNIMSKLQKGQNNNFYGCKHSDNSKLKMSINTSKTKRIIVDNKVCYFNANTAAKEIGLHRRTISRRCLNDNFPDWQYI